MSARQRNSQAEETQEQLRQILAEHHALGPFAPPLRHKEIARRLPRRISRQKLWAHLRAIYRSAAQRDPED